MVGNRSWTEGVDPRICQTFAASPAEPGNSLVGLGSAPSGERAGGTLPAISHVGPLAVAASNTIGTGPRRIETSAAEAWKVSGIAPGNSNSEQTCRPLMR